MKITTLLASGFLAATLAGCASSGGEAPPAAKPAAPAPAAKAAASAPAAASPNAPKNAVSATFNAPLSRTHDAAVEAAKQSGFEIGAASTDTFVTGPRPRKIGLVVGSGGETINIALKSMGDSTQVTVWTKRTFVGGAGQKDWDAPVIAAMKAQLGG